MTLADVRRVVKGTLYGRKNFEIRSIRSPQDAGPHDLSFLFDDTTGTDAGAIVARKKYPRKSGIIVKDPKRALHQLLEHVSKRTRKGSISPQSIIHHNVTVPRSCIVGAFTVIENGVQLGRFSHIGSHCYVGENVVIGEHCEMHSHCTVYPDTVIGKHVCINANTVIGKEGFGFIRKKRYERLRHIGDVVIGDYVEIGSNVTIDRGTIGTTRIGEGTKIDNLVHVAHNVMIGKNCMIMGQSGIAGSSILGDSVILCGQVGIADHVKIGDNVVVYAKSAVFKSIPKNKEYSGIPAREHDAVMRALARLYHSK